VGGRITGRRIVQKADVRRRRSLVHVLRHTFASQLLALGESLTYVKEQMGHRSIQITADVYGHIIPGANRNAVDRLDEPRVAKSLQTAGTPALNEASIRRRSWNRNPLNKKTHPNSLQRPLNQQDVAVSAISLARRATSRRYLPSRVKFFVRSAISRRFLTTV
jgi:integrase-like protein